MTFFYKNTISAVNTSVSLTKTYICKKKIIKQPVNIFYQK